MSGAIPSLFTFLRRDVPVPGWLFLGGVVMVTIEGVLGLHLIVTWLS